MRTTGECFCGEIGYVAQLDEKRMGICHCRDCQIFSGSAFRTSAMVDPGSFEITRGEPRYYDKTAASGKVRRMAFCGTCGTHICSLPADPAEAGAFVSLRVATSKEFHLLEPFAEIWCRSRVGWMPELSSTVKIEGQP